MILYKWLLRSAITIIILVLLLIAFLLTPYGLKSVAYLAAHKTSATIHYASVNGLLTGPITIEQLDYVKKGDHIHIDHLELNWNPLQLLQKKLDITQLTLQGVRVIRHQNQSTSKKTFLNFIKNIKPFEPKRLHLPVLLEIHHAHLSNIIWGSPEDDFYMVIKKSEISGYIYSDKINFAIKTEFLKPQPAFSQLTLQGSLHHYTLQADIKDHTHHITLSVVGNKKGATLTIPKNTALSGSIQGLIDVSWYPHLSWNATLAANKINPQLLYKALPQLMTLSLKSQGTLKHGAPNFDLSAQVDANKATAQLQMHYHKTPNATWIINIPNLPDLYSHHNFHITQLYVTGQFINNTIMTHADIDQHALMMTINAQYQHKNWTGNITQLTAKQSEFGNWTLQRPAQFFYSSEKMSLKSLCLNEKNGVFLCAQAFWQKNKPWELSVQSKNFNFNNLEKMMSPDITINSALSVNIIATGVGSQINHAQGKIDIAPGKLTYKTNEQTLDLAIRHSTFAIIVNKKIGFNAAGTLNLALQDAVKINATIPSFTENTIPLKNKPLHGNLNINLSTIRSLTLFNHILKFSCGQIKGNFTLNGTLNSPIFMGDATLKIPTFEYTTAMMHAQNSTAQIHVERKKITYALTGYAFNKALIHLKGDTDFAAANPVTHLILTTQHAELIKNNQLDIFADGTTTFLFTTEALDISGNILITSARITPIDFSGILEMPKNNVVYIGLPEKEVVKSTHKTTLNLKIQLGNNIYFKGYGIQAELGGSIVLTLSPEQSIIGNGQVHILHGRFQAYGQNLLMDQGSSISFIQSPITNPFINARGYKRITTTTLGAGNQLAGDTIIVGVQVQGTVHNMKFNLYSQPSGLSQADILSYLILGYASANANSASFSVLLDAASAMASSGNNIEQSVGFVDRLKQSLGIKELGVSNETVIDAIGNPIQDQSSFVVGDQISKNIYIRYRRGMGISDNIFTVEYHFNKHWYLQTTTSSGGSVGTGADIIYQIDTN